MFQFYRLQRCAARRFAVGRFLVRGFCSGMALVVPMLGLAQAELEWRKVRAFGGGDGTRCLYEELGDPADNNIFWVASGSEVSFVFSVFGVNLPASRNPLRGKLKYAASCNIEAEVVIPQGHFVATLAQTLTYGVVKDAGTTGGLTTGAFLFQNDVPLNQINLFVPPEAAMNEPLFTKSNVQIFDPGTRQTQCALTAGGPLVTTFKMQLLSAGARPAPFLSMLINVDSADVQYSLAPSLQRCL